MATCTVTDINYELCTVFVEKMQEQQERLDLIWWGAWGCLGLLLVVLIAGKWYSAFRVTRGG